MSVKEPPRILIMVCCLFPQMQTATIYNSYLQTLQKYLCPTTKDEHLDGDTVTIYDDCMKIKEYGDSESPSIKTTYPAKIS